VDASSLAQTATELHAAVLVVFPIAAGLLVAIALYRLRA
jgi:hypothetical protein